MIFSPGDLVQVENLSDTPLTIGYDNRHYPILPGKPAYIPFEAAILWFGDPRSTESTQSIDFDGGKAIIPDRASEVRRLCSRYGFTDGTMEDFLSDGDARVPKVKVTSLADEEITTVLHDPIGETINLTTITIAERTTQDALIQALQRQVQQLSSRLAEVDDKDDEVGNIDLSIEDELITPPPVVKTTPSKKISSSRNDKVTIPEDDPITF